MKDGKLKSGEQCCTGGSLMLFVLRKCTGIEQNFFDPSATCPSRDSCSDEL